MLANVAADDWYELVKSALEQWHQPVELSQHALKELKAVRELHEEPLYAEEVHGRAKALRSVLRSRIRLLGDELTDPPVEENDPRWADRAWRYYSLLNLLYIVRLPRGLVQQRIGLAEGGRYFREQRKAIDLLAMMLRDEEGQPKEEAATIAMEYPTGAVKLTSRYYIDRKADADLRNELAKPGVTINIRGSRQVGKTSLLIRGAQIAKQLHGARVVYFDLQGVGSKCLTSLDQFLRELAEWIIDDLDLDLDQVEKIWQSKLGPQRKLTKLLANHVLVEGNVPIILAMDEIDRLLIAGFHTEFFGLVRSWCNRRAQDPRWNNLNIILAISTEPYLLINDVNQSPFNVGLTLRLVDFTFEQSQELNRRYNSPMSDGELQQLFELLNGHPFLTRMALYTLVQEELSWKDLATRALSGQDPFREHLEHLYHLVADDPSLTEALKKVINNNTCVDENAKFRLLKAGLIRSEGNECNSRCELYRVYFSKRL